MSQYKKQIIYEAALSLVNEKNDMSRIKVADIADRANIGKSTVYEYFDSKEQVIAEAVIFMLKTGITSFELIIEEDRGFKETYMLLLENIASVMSKNRSIFEYMTMNDKNLVVHSTITNIVHTQLEELKSTYFRMVEKLVDKSVSEGIIKEKPSKYDWYTAVLCSTTCIFVHKQCGNEFDDLKDEDVLSKAYNVYIKLLN